MPAGVESFSQVSTNSLLAVRLRVEVRTQVKSTAGELAQVDKLVMGQVAM